MKTTELTSTQALNAISFLLKPLKLGKWFDYAYGKQCYLYSAYGSKVGTLEMPTRMTHITKSDGRVEINCADKKCYRLKSFNNIALYANYPMYNDETKEWTFINENRVIED